MGILDALNTSVGGLRAQSYALENISGNIANSQTTAFKRLDTSFEDLIGDGPPSQQKAGSVLATSRATNTVQGAVQTASIGTFMAINGDGFFVIQRPSAFKDNQPVFDGTQLYTRRGDFQIDKNGYFVNGAGYYLMGIPLDPVTGNQVGSVPQLLKFQKDFLPAVATTQIEYHANLASYPLTPKHDKAIPKSELLDPTTFTVDPTNAGTGTVVANDLTTFLNQSISGGAVTAYDVSGAPVNFQLRWAKTDSSLYGGTDTWNLFYQVSTTATGAQVAWKNAGVDYKFGANGQMSPVIANVTLAGVTVDGISLGTVQLVQGAGGVTQFADPNGIAQVNLLQQNGFPSGQLQNISVNDKGVVVGGYSNGRNIDLADITLANFNGPNYLKRIDGGAFAVTNDSGPALYGATGKIVGSSLEGSNSDIADEFTKLIITQQAYSANTKIITTANTMVQDLLNMIR